MDVTDVFFSGSGGNAVSLRPEFKLSSDRQFIDKIADIQFLLRLRYAGPVFRHDENQRVFINITDNSLPYFERTPSYLRLP